MDRTYPRFRPEIRDWAVRVLRSEGRLGGNRRVRIEQLAEKIGCAPATLANWVREAERADDDKATSPERKLRAFQREVAALKRENRKLRQERDRYKARQPKPDITDQDN